MSYEGDLIEHYRGVRRRLGGVVTVAVRRRDEENEQAIEQVWPEVLPAAAEEPPAEPPARLPVWKGIVREVCERHGVSILAVLSHRRDRESVFARHEVFYRLATETPMSTPQIGYRIGGFDHTTVLHGIRKHKERMGIA